MDRRQRWLRTLAEAIIFGLWWTLLAGAVFTATVLGWSSMSGGERAFGIVASTALAVCGVIAVVNSRRQPCGQKYARCEFCYRNRETCKLAERAD